MIFLLIFSEAELKRAVFLMAVIVYAPAVCLADVPNVPEIHASAAMTALTLLGGSLMLVREYLRK